LAALSASQKSSAGVSLYSRYVNRPLGRVLAAAAASAGLSPNAVTVLSAAATAGGLVVLIAVPPSWGPAALSAALLVVGFALDSADGQVARLTGRGSPAGEWLDHVVDAGKMVAVHGAVLVAALRHGLLPEPWLYLPLAYQLLSAVFFAALTIFELLQRQRAGTPAPKRPSTMRAIALLPADYGILAVAFVLWGWPPLFFVVYAMLFVGTLCIALALARKWYRTLRDPIR